MLLVCLAAGPAAVAEQIDEGTLNAICDDPSTGSELAAQCEIFDLDGPTRDAAVSGNNFGTTGASGRGMAEAREHMRALREEEEEEGSGQAADWVVGKLGLFINGNGKWRDRRTTANEVGSDTATYGFTAGGDWRFSDRFIAGGAFTYSNGSTDFNSNAGDLDTESFGGLLFASFAPNETLYFDAYAGYAVQDYDGRRNIAFVAGGAPVAATAASNTDGAQWSAGASAGADFALGPVTLGPHAQFDYLKTDIDSYAESGGSGFATAFGDQDIESAQGVLGVHASVAASTDWGVLVPYARLDWVHEFSDRSRDVPASFVQSPGTPFTVSTDQAGRDFGRVTLGISAIWPGGLIAFIDYQNQFAKTHETEHRLVIGLRKEL
jgi:uncharacterized protein with beta-barrel porin domain